MVPDGSSLKQTHWLSGENIGAPPGEETGASLPSLIQHPKLP
jgi:hypothetical protein